MIGPSILTSGITIFEIMAEENHVVGVHSYRGEGCRYFDKVIVKMKIQFS